MAFISPDTVTSGSCTISRLVTLRLTKKVSYTSTGGGWVKKTTYYNPQDPYNQEHSHTLRSSNQAQRVYVETITEEFCFLSDGMTPPMFEPCTPGFLECPPPRTEIIAEKTKTKESIWVSPKSGSSPMGQCSVFYIYKKDDTLGTCICPDVVICSESSGASFRVQTGTSKFQETMKYQESRSLQKISSNYGNLNSPALGPINSLRQLEITPECISVFSTRTIKTLYECAPEASLSNPYRCYWLGND